ncbi:MAG: 4Fe-4S dicluster domain-containing protein [Promethearchaeota archaeon]|nr:MAG: 4Fe-4S dicluster domain-containing protein [Candidatus Lokiarchaeota archaeon]
MPIVGIDKDKCTKCGLCVNECPASNITMEGEDGVAMFDPLKPCINCGHCIAICPTNAVMYKRMKDDALSFEGVQDPSKLIPHETMYQFIRAKRSIRQYKEDKVPPDMLKKVIDSMRYAPTGTNLRNMKCLVISDAEKIKTLSEEIVNAWSMTMPGEYSKMLQQKREGDPIFYNAPHVIILHSKSSSPMDYINAAIAMTYGMFCAQSLGLGTCWIGLAYIILSQNKELQKKTTGIRGKILGIMSIGYPAVKYHRAPPRPPLRTKGLN